MKDVFNQENEKSPIGNNTLQRGSDEYNARLDSLHEKILRDAETLRQKRAAGLLPAPVIAPEQSAPPVTVEELAKALNAKIVGVRRHTPL